MSAAYPGGMSGDTSGPEILELLDRINAAFHGLGPEPYANINRLTRLCGEILGADAAVYYRKVKDSLFAVGLWGLPEDFNTVVPASESCPAQILSAPGASVHRRASPDKPLPCTRFCSQLRAATCVGRAVTSAGENIGLLCALSRTDTDIHPLCNRLIDLVTAALAVEEERLRMERASQKLSEELRQSQKMEAIGLLAGGIAHDFNNVLTAIRGNAELLQARQDIPAPAQDEAQEIIKAAEYASSLTRQLLTFSRKQVNDPRTIDLNRTVTSLAHMLGRTIGEHIRLELRLEQEPACIRADPGQIEQVILNLSVNARDAMPEGGRLSIRTKIVEIGAAEAPALLRDRPGRYVLLSVEDTGVGMTRDVQRRLFEPFFTTKEMGKGTGLGLSTVYGIVRQNNGDISVSSQAGKGSIFAILWPALEKTAIAETQNPGLEGLLSKGESILLVEDEDSVRSMVARVLRGAKFTVLDACDGRKALEILAKNGPVDLLVTDIVMPGMSGYQLAQEVRKVLPDLRVLFMSGYADEALLRAASASGRAAIVMKPFSPTDLLRRIQTLLKAGA